MNEKYSNPIDKAIDEYCNNLGDSYRHKKVSHEWDQQRLDNFFYFRIDRIQRLIDEINYLIDWRR